MTNRNLIANWILSMSIVLWAGFQANVARADMQDAMVTFFSLKETVAKLLPSTENMTRRDIVLEKRHIKRLQRYKNWDTAETEFVIYHSRNRENRIIHTMILFPENTRQGPVVVAVALDNEGIVSKAIVMEARQTTLQWLMPLLRADYMDTFTGKDQNLRLALDKKFKTGKFPPISQSYGLRLANAVKKSAQLFHVFFNRKD